MAHALIEKGQQAQQQSAEKEEKCWRHKKMVAVYAYINFVK